MEYLVFVQENLKPDKFLFGSGLSGLGNSRKIMFPKQAWQSGAAGHIGMTRVSIQAYNTPSPGRMSTERLPNGLKALLK